MQHSDKCWRAGQTAGQTPAKPGKLDEQQVCVLHTGFAQANGSAGTVPELILLGSGTVPAVTVVG